MTTPIQTDAAMEAALRDPRATAPPRVSFGALVEAGLADHYAPIATPLGQVFVAWNGRGVSWVAAGDDGETFERTFRAKVGRAIERDAALPSRLRSAIERCLRGDRRRERPTRACGRSCSVEPARCHRPCRRCRSRRPPCGPRSPPDWLRRTG